MMRRHSVTMTGISPAAAGNGSLATQHGLSRYSFFQIDALITGGTGGTVDIYLQRLIDATNDIWLDWCHFTQVAATITKRYTVSSIGNGTLVEVGQMNTAFSGSLVLAAGTCVGGHPGDVLRVLAVAGAGTSAGAGQTVYIHAYEEYT
jgi:hypothetical protein